MVTSGLDSILDKAGVTVEEMKEAFVSIVNGQKDLTNMNERFNAFASANAEAFESLAAAQTSESHFVSGYFISNLLIMPGRDILE
ncbi:hypothetical protein DPMN_036668 [Dreissena polymorpha]|uniref:Uncharacterized protein n=1 Tax=Dreissena polymorpha TaxID=45954 RepID=A0A9D4RNC0_DREPO|nr:hypothetical protein DPMN_036668 [Dreissena polymorpha]